MQFEQAYTFLINELEQKLPAHLTYHNVEHTKEIVQKVQYIAKAEGVSDEDFQVLSTAALFHDAGFLKGYNNHEELSCELAKTYLPNFDYTREQIEKICNQIMVTKLPQTPSDKLENILCDADLYYLGTDKYFPIAEDLYNEWKETGFIKNRAEWLQKQIQFLESHQFFTKTAIEECSMNKKQNLLHLKAISKQPGQKKEALINGFQDIFLIISGVILAGFGLKGFLVPNHFIDGGVTGLSLLLSDIYNFNLSYTTFILNLPFIIASYFTVGRKFAFRTFICVVLLSICLLYFPYHQITEEKLLVSIFGGFFVGLGAGLIMRAGCAIDGIDVLALYTWKRTSFTISEIILALNVIIFGIAAFHFGIQTALYSILTYLAASKTIDYVVEGIEAYTGVTIISGESEAIKHRLVNELGRGITIYKGERGYLPDTFEVSSQCDIIFTVITRLELRKLKNLVHETDPKAFVFANTIKDASGGIIKRRHLH